MDLHNIINFFKKNNISEHNQSIVIEYLEELSLRGMKRTTLTNYEHFLRFLVKHTQTDLDKLTTKDIKHIQLAINDWTKKNGEPAHDTSKTEYKIKLQQFLKGYGELIENKELTKLANFKFSKAEGKKLEAEDILSEEEVDEIILCCNGLRDKALVSMIYELGARVGEIANLKISDVKDHPHGFHISLNGKTGKRQVLLHRNQSHLKRWLDVHPNANDPKAPLFTTAREYTDSSYGKNKKKQAKDEPRAHTPLKIISMSRLLKIAAKKAGIEKNVYCHLLRHSQATRLANTMTEQQLKKQFGWAGSSNMTSTYIHLSNPEVDNAVLASYGIIVNPDKEGNKINRCARCSTPILPGIKYCDCGMPLTFEAASVEEEVKSKIEQMFLEDKEMFDMIRDRIKQA